MKRNVYKCEVIIDDEGELHISSYENRQISHGLLDSLNTAVHEIADKYNGKADWKKSYIQFTEDGKTYMQFDKPIGTKFACDACCFYKKENGCTHPHYLDGTKGVCGDKAYKIIKQTYKV
jgi:hypothetical protein